MSVIKYKVILCNHVRDYPINYIDSVIIGYVPNNSNTLLNFDKRSKQCICWGYVQERKQTEEQVMDWKSHVCTLTYINKMKELLDEWRDSGLVIYYILLC